MPVDIGEERKGVMRCCLHDFSAFFERRILDKSAEFVRDVDSFHQVIEILGIGQSVVFGQEWGEPVADLIILCLVLCDVYVQDQIVVCRKSCDNDRSLREVPVSADFRDEKCVCGAAAEHVADRIARRERVCFLQKPAQHRRQDEQKTGDVVASCYDFFSAGNLVGREKCNDKIGETLAVKEQVSAGSYNVGPVYLDVEDKS